MTRLWEAPRRYIEIGNHHKNGLHERGTTWGEFMQATADWDVTTHILVTWQWERTEHGVLGMFTTWWFGTGKATRWSMECFVHPDEEPEVRAWLAPRYAALAALWQPLPSPTPNEIAPYVKEN